MGISQNHSTLQQNFSKLSLKTHHCTPFFSVPFTLALPDWPLVTLTLTGFPFVLVLFGLQLLPYSNQQIASVEGQSVGITANKMQLLLGRKKQCSYFVFLYLTVVSIKHIDCSFQREGENANFGLCASEAFRIQKLKKNDSTERRLLLIYGPYENVVEQPKCPLQRQFHTMRHKIPKIIQNLSQIKMIMLKTIAG